MKYLLIVIVTATVFLVFIIPLKNQLSDCRFEYNHLQAKLYRCQELSDYVEILEQLPPLVVAELKAANEVIQQARYRSYERVEQPLIEKK